MSRVDTPTPLPNFLIIGAPKCGTTALYAAAAPYSQVYMCWVKEPYFFAFDSQPPGFTGPGAEHYRQRAIPAWEAYPLIVPALRRSQPTGAMSAPVQQL